MSDSPATDGPAQTAPRPPGRLRIASYNVEWFNALFDDAGRLLSDDEPSARYRTTRRQQIEALGQVFRALDADGIMVIEAPDQGTKRSSTRALEIFAAQFGLRARRAVIGFPSETEQEIAFLFDPDRMAARHDPLGGPSPGEVPRFDSSFRYDLNADGVFDSIRFSKPPLELAVDTIARPDGTGRRLRVIGVHAKSKAPHGVKNPDTFNRISIENRRKQLAECLWLRARVDSMLDRNESLVVLGDFNDGPGLDEYEALFGHSGVEIVMGLEDDHARRLQEAHAAMALRQPLGLSPTSARFWLAPMKRYFEALVDFIMLSPDLCVTGPEWRIWHPFNDPEVAKIPGLDHALLTASDHFPVTVDLTL